MRIAVIALLAGCGGGEGDGPAVDTVEISAECTLTGTTVSGTGVAEVVMLDAEKVVLSADGSAAPEAPRSVVVDCGSWTRDGDGCVRGPTDPSRQTVTFDMTLTMSAGVSLIATAVLLDAQAVAVTDNQFVAFCVN
jgi:hypothetical protein